MKSRVAVVVSHPIQHFCPLYRALAQTGRIDLRVIFGSKDGLRGYFDPGFNQTIQWEGDLVQGFSHEFLPGAESVKSVGSVDSPHLATRLSEIDPEVVLVYGFWHGISRRAIAWARSHRRRVMQVADSELRTKRPFMTRLRKRISVPWLLRRVDVFLTVGDCNEAYYRAYGASATRFFRSPYPIDEGRLSNAVSGRPELRRQMRADLGIPQDAIVALTVGKLSGRKCPEHAILALAALNRFGHQSATHLVFAGDGVRKEGLQRLARERAPGLVHFPGFVNMDRLPGFYVAADYLVHPSSEDPHPLATSEAVYCGLPVIVSNRVGSVGPTDDVRLGENGVEYPFGDTHALSLAMAAMADGARRETMAARSYSIGKQRGLDASVDGVLRALTYLRELP